MVRLLSIVVYKDGSDEKIHYESFPNKQFRSNLWIRKWVEYQKLMWEEIAGFPVKVYKIQRAKPEVYISMDAVVSATCRVMGQSIKSVVSKGRKRNIVDTRKTICMILIDLDYTAMEIEKQLSFMANRTIYTYINAMEDRFETEKGFEKEYDKIKKEVMRNVMPKYYVPATE